MAFMATINSITHTFVYEQGGSTNANGTNTLVDLSGTPISDLNALISTTVDPIVLDLGTPGYLIHFSQQRRLVRHQWRWH